MANRKRIKEAQQAFKEKNVELARKLHAQSYDLHNTRKGKFLKSSVYGGLDGIITTFAVVAGVAGAGLDLQIILILGFSNLIADGLSMAIGDYLSSKSQHEYNLLERERESWELEHLPEGEIKEMTDLYQSKGMSEEDANLVVHTMAKYKPLFIDTMMAEELGIIEDSESPMKNAVATFVSFLLFGFIPLLTPVLAYFFPVLRTNSFLVSIVLTGITLFILGSAKSRVSGANLFRSGFEMMLVGGLAASAAYVIGHILGGLAG